MPEDLLNVKGKVVILTGGLGRLGRQFTRTLTAHGAKVAVFDLAVASRCLDPDNQVFLLDVDVTNRSTIKDGLHSVIELWGVPHALINNAALDSPPDAADPDTGPFETYQDSSWRKVMAVNVDGVVNCCQVVGGQMAREGRGSIVNVSSIYGLLSPDQRLYDHLRSEGKTFYKPVAYSVSKAAILNLTRYLATYWGTSNLRVNSVTFGGVYSGQDERFVRAYSARTPLGRMAREDEYNGAILFLVSDASSYMTGSNLVIDGGWTAW